MCGVIHFNNRTFAGSELTLVINAVSERNIEAVVPAALCTHLVHVTYRKHTQTVDTLLSFSLTKNICS